MVSRQKVKFMISRISNAASVISCAGLVLVLAIMTFYVSRFGFDLTDEGFWLSSVAEPDLYPETTTLFGFFLQPIWTLSDNNVYHYRILTLLILGLSSWLMMFTIINRYSFSSSLCLLSRLLLSAALASSIYTYLISWPATAGYNQLNLFALLMVATGLVATNQRSHKWFSAGFALIGLGGAIAFAAKATTAAALSILVSCYLGVLAHRSDNRNTIFRGALFAMFVAVVSLLITSVFVAGSPAALYRNMYAGFNQGQMLIGTEWVGSGILWRGSYKTAAIGSGLVIGVLVFSAIVLIQSIVSQRSLKRLEAFAGSCAVAAVIFVGMVLTGDLNNPMINSDPSYRATILLLPQLLIFAGLVLFRRGREFRSTSSNGVLAIALISLTYAFTVGTYNNYFFMVSVIPIFLVAANLVLISGLELHRSKDILYIFAILVSSSTVLALDAVGPSMYRQAKHVQTGSLLLGDQSEPRKAISSNSRLAGLHLSPEAKTYFEEVDQLAKENGFKTGMPMIDLSGASPGLLFALQARSLGAAWLIGGYQGSEKKALNSLLNVAQSDLDSAWVLHELNWARSFSGDFLQKLGKSLKQDYVLAFSINIPPGLGGRRTANTQNFYKPRP